MVTAAYDEIADWYAEKFPGGRRAGTGAPDGDSPGDRRSETGIADGDLLGIGRGLRDLLGEGSGACLEIGCGTGNYAASVRALGWTPIGIDLAAGMLRHARGRLPLARADAARLPVRDGCVPGRHRGDGAHRHACLPGGAARGGPCAAPRRAVCARRRPPCFCGGFADRADPGAVVIRPGYLDSHWTKASWTDQGARDKVGATHWPLPDLLHAFIDAGLTPERLAEGGAPTPVVLALRARKHQ